MVEAVGDAVGKGHQAARHSAFTRTALASVAAFSDDPGRLLQWVNVALVERIGESSEFVTAACVTYDRGTRVLRFASAGHPRGLRLESGDELTPERTGAALGLALEVDCRERAERLGADDGVLLYTDGLVEARGGESRYGTNRLSEVLRHGKRLTPPEILELLKRDLREFAGERISEMSACWFSAASSRTPPSLRWTLQAAQRSIPSRDRFVTAAGSARPRRACYAPHTLTTTSCSSAPHLTARR